MQEPHMDDIVLHESSDENGVVNFETRAVWFFHEFWPMMIFGALFVLMVSLPVILSGQFAALNKFVTSDVVWSGYGLLIIGAYLLALALTFTMPRLMGWYLLVLSILALVVTEGGEAWAVGPSIAVIFAVYMLVAIAVLPRREEKNTAGH